VVRVADDIYKRGMEASGVPRTSRTGRASVIRPEERDGLVTAVGGPADPAPPAAVRPILERSISARRKLGKRDTTLRGVCRPGLVADTVAKSLDIARRDYPRWRTNFFWLFRRHGAAPRVVDLYTESFDQLAALNTAVAGSPQTVRDFIAAEIEATSPNYFVPWLAFGDMTLEESLRSVDLFAREVMPGFR